MPEKPLPGPTQTDELDPEKIALAARLVVAQACLIETRDWAATLATAAEALAVAPTVEGQATAARCALEFLKVGRKRLENAIGYLEI